MIIKAEQTIQEIKISHQLVFLTSIYIKTITNGIDNRKRSKKPNMEFLLRLNLLFIFFVSCV